MAKYGIGQAITRREDQRLLTGTGKYVDDLVLPGQVFAAFVRSPHPRARITSVDGTNAQLMPGVLAVYSGADVLADDLGAMPIPTGPVAAQAGQTWQFTAWNRDAAPTATSNFTDALAIPLQ